MNRIITGLSAIRPYVEEITAFVDAKVDSGLALAEEGVQVAAERLRQEILPSATFHRAARWTHFAYNLPTNAFLQASFEQPILPASYVSVATLRRLDQLIRLDWQDARDGHYPFSLLLKPERLPDEVLGLLPFVAEIRGMLARKNDGEKTRADFESVKNDPKLNERLLTLGCEGEEIADYFMGLSAAWYYYRNNFHWLPWLTEDAARYYEPGVNALFLTSLNMMRRRTLPILKQELTDVNAPVIAEFACGPGQLLSMVGETMPSARLTGLDADPFLLTEARKRLPLAALLPANVARPTRLAAGSQDAVIIGYLFHELPAPERRKVLDEALRVLKPGALVLLYDAIQISDQDDPETAWLAQHVVDTFPKSFFEPYFENYTRDDLAKILAEKGFANVASVNHLATRYVTGRKGQSNPI